MTAISLIGMYELYRVLNMEKSPLAAVGYLTAVAYYGLVWFEGTSHVTLLAIGTLMVMMSLYVFQFPKYKTEEVACAFFGVFYGRHAFPPYQVRAMADGKYLVWLIFLSSWGQTPVPIQVGAFWKTQNGACAESEKNPLRGAIGGIAGSALLGILFAGIFGAKFSSVANPQAACAIACAIAAAISQIGDLAASAIDGITTSRTTAPDSWSRRILDRLTVCCLLRRRFILQ